MTPKTCLVMGCGGCDGFAPVRIDPRAHARMELDRATLHTHHNPSRRRIIVRRIARLNIEV